MRLGETLQIPPHSTRLIGGIPSEAVPSLGNPNLETAHTRNATILGEKIYQ
jgi:hypothetical protein